MTCSGWGWGLGDSRSAEQPGENHFQVETAVESVLDFGEIMMRLFDEIEGVIRFGECSLQITQKGVDRAKLLKLDAGTTPAGHGTFVSASRSHHGFEAPQTIRHHMDRCRQRRLRPLRQRLFGDCQRRQTHQQWMVAGRPKKTGKAADKSTAEPTAKKTAAKKPTDKPITTGDCGMNPPPSTDNVATARMPTLLFRIPMELRWRDLDAFNHVNNTNFMTYVEEARTRWFGSASDDWFTGQHGPLLASITMNHRKPTPYPAQIAVELFAERIGNSSLTLGHRIVDAAGDTQTLYADGHSVLVWIDIATGRPIPLPEGIRAAAAADT
jgi:acyl-CoA thioester hydrolase